jgi:hypothetical protein
VLLHPRAENHVTRGDIAPAATTEIFGVDASFAFAFAFLPKERRAKHALFV